MFIRLEISSTKLVQKSSHFIFKSIGWDARNPVCSAEKHARWKFYEVCMPSVVIAANLAIASFKEKQLFCNFSDKFEKKNYRAVQEAISICVIKAKHN